MSLAASTGVPVGHVQLAHDLGHRQVLERGDRLLERPDRRRQAEVELVADRVDRDAPIEQALDEGVHPLALAGLLGVVVVDREDDRAVDAGRRVHVVERLVGEGEGVVDERLAEDVVPGAPPEAVGLGRAVGDDLVDHVEGDERVRGAAERPVQVAQGLGHVEDVVVQPGAEERLVGVARRQRRAVVVLEEPGRGLAVPDERVAVDAGPVVLGEVHDRLGLGVDPERLRASYQASGFMWFSGVTWSKCRSRSSDEAPVVSRESIALPEREVDRVLDRGQVLDDRRRLRRDGDVVDEERRGRAVRVAALEVEEGRVRLAHRVGRADLDEGRAGHGRELAERCRTSRRRAFVRRMLSQSVSVGLPAANLTHAVIT